jgi:hypothetical protein
MPNLKGVAMSVRPPAKRHTVTIRRWGTALAALGVALGMSLVSAPASHSEPLTGPTWVAATSGVAWTPQTITIKTGKKAGSTVTIAVTGSAGGSTTLTAPITPAGFASASWTPTASGIFTITATGAAGQLGTSSVIVVPAPTVTTLFVPGNVEPDRPVSVFAQVRTLSSDTPPSGVVTIRNQNDVILTAGLLRPTGRPGEAWVRMEWLPRVGAPTLTGTFDSDTNAFARSTSPGGKPLIGGTWSAALALPPAMYLGVPAQVGAVMGPGVPLTVGGSVTFVLDIDGRTQWPTGGSTQVTEGVAWSKWTPRQQGNQIFRAFYSSGNFRYGGAPAQWINILPAPEPDVITVTPTGAPAWTSGPVGTLTQGNTVTLTPTSASGNPVTMSSDGPCAFEDAVLTILGPGTCTITATSYGNGGSLTGTQTDYTITALAAPKKKKKRR